jgi:multiple sugar transport system substrate-binding protein
VLPIAGKLNLDNVDGVRTDQLNEVQLDMIRDWSDGELTGLPRSASVRGGFVLNKTMFDELGIELPERSWTWEDFAEVAQKVHDASNGETYGALDETGGITYGSFGLRAWALSHFGVPITLENGRLGLNRDQLREMYAWWGELRESGAVTPASISVSADDQQNNPIVTGDSAMVAMSLGSFGRFQGNTEDTLVLRPFPQGEYKNNEIAPGVTMSISSATEHQELAVQFLNFMINDLEAGKILGTQVGIPANAERRQWLQESGDLGRIARLQFQTNNWVLDNLGSIPFITRPEDFTKFRDRRFSAEQALAFGETSMSETLDQIIQIAEDMDWEVPASPRDPISEQQ